MLLHKSAWLFCAIIIVVGALAGISYTLFAKVNPPIHYHAGFVVYVDGVKQDFSDFKYMDIEPCTDHKESHVHEDDQIEKAHLHDGVGDVVHVHRNGAKWSDLFQNIKYSFPDGKSIKGYVGGQPVEDILNQPITAYESVVMIVGDQKDVDPITSAVPLSHIQEVESKSELCGTSG